MAIKQNEDYTTREFNVMESALKLIIKRANKGLQYGPDMPSSRAAILNDIAELCGWAFVDSEVIRLGGK